MTVFPLVAKVSLYSSEEVWSLKFNNFNNGIIKYALCSVFKQYVLLI